MAKRTLKSMGIKRTSVRKHGVLISAYEHKGNFYGNKQAAEKAYVNAREKKIHKKKYY